MRPEHRDIEEDIVPDDDAPSDKCFYALSHFFPDGFSEKHAIGNACNHRYLLCHWLPRIDEHAPLFSVYGSKNISISFELESDGSDFDDCFFRRIESCGLEVEGDESVVREIHTVTLLKNLEKSKRSKNES